MKKENNQPICKTDEFGKYWYLDSIIHREDGPAVEYLSGAKCWCFHGKYHRLDGPAIENTNGDKFWFFHEKLINCSSQEEFERLIKLKILW